MDAFKLGKKAAANMKDHVLVSGHSGSGKSTLSEQLGKQLGMPVVKMDDDPRWKAQMSTSDWEQTSPTVAALRKQMVADVLKTKKPSVIEGTQLLSSPELSEGYRKILVDVPEHQVVRQRMARDRKKPDKVNPRGESSPFATGMKPGSAFARRRAQLAKDLIAQIRGEVSQAQQDPDWEKMRAKKADDDLKELGKQAASVVERLLEAKRESDRKNYPAKHEILRQLIKETPGDFAVDDDSGKYDGITHKPSGFQIHGPKGMVPKPTTSNYTFDQLGKLAAAHMDK